MITLYKKGSNDKMKVWSIELKGRQRDHLLGLLRRKDEGNQ